MSLSSFYSCLLFLVIFTPAFGFASSPDAGQLTLNRLFSDHAVLQRQQELPVWGSAAPGAPVTITFAGQSCSTNASARGEWRVNLAPVDAGGPFTITAVSGAETVTVHDVLVGEVWLCSGQSNMECPVYNPEYWLYESTSGKYEAAAADYPSIRLFTVENKPSQSPRTHVSGQWKVCSPKTVADFSGVGYFFGRTLYQHLNVPVGLIDNSVGGTPAEAWTSRDTLASTPVIAPIITSFDAYLPQYDRLDREISEQLKKRDDFLKVIVTNNTGFARGWAGPEADTSAWQTLRVPGPCALNKDDGVLWFKRSVTIPARWYGKPLRLALGPVDNFDITYVNGVNVGETGSDIPESWTVSRFYTVPAGIVTSSPLVIAVRVCDIINNGGLPGPATGLFLTAVNNPDDRISLAGTWLTRKEVFLNETYAKPPYLIGAENQEAPAVLFNSRVNPLIPFGLRGILWYQGESNAERAFQYRDLFPAMVRSWRALWGKPDMPFLFVQIASYLFQSNEPTQHNWAELREAQLLSLRELSNSAMAVTIDIGEDRNIHPHNKQAVGKRLSLAARALAYNEPIEYSGPLYRSMIIESNTVRILFDHCASGLCTKADKPLKRFSIAGPDHVFKWASAKIDGNVVIVSNPDISQPVAVRYAWETNPEGCNLYNSEGLPASPFRTDDWAGLTDTNVLPAYVRERWW